MDDIETPQNPPRKGLVRAVIGYSLAGISVGYLVLLNVALGGGFETVLGDPFALGTTLGGVVMTAAVAAVLPLAVALVGNLWRKVKPSPLVAGVLFTVCVIFFAPKVWDDPRPIVENGAVRTSIGVSFAFGTKPSENLVESGGQKSWTFTESNEEGTSQVTITRTPMGTAGERRARLYYDGLVSGYLQNSAVRLEERQDTAEQRIPVLLCRFSIQGDSEVSELYLKAYVHNQFLIVTQVLPASKTSKSSYFSNIKFD